MTETKTGTKTNTRLRAVLCGFSAALAVVLLLWPPAGVAARTGAGRWELMVVGYPDGREVEVSLGGSERALSSKGSCTVKWSKGAAEMELKAENLPSPESLGWAGAHYTVWAVDSDKHVINLGPLPLKGKDAEWKGRAPARSFGLLITAEKSEHTASPSDAVVMESLLPTDAHLVLPVFRVDVALTTPGS